MGLRWDEGAAKSHRLPGLSGSDAVLEYSLLSRQTVLFDADHSRYRPRRKVTPQLMLSCECHYSGAPFRRSLGINPQIGRSSILVAHREQDMYVA